MDESELDKILGMQQRKLYTNRQDIEFEINGDATRQELASDIDANPSVICDQAMKLLKSFMKHEGVFELNSVEVFELADNEGAEFCLWYHFTADHDPHEYGYTYFKVFFSKHEPPQPTYWPFKFTVGFH